MNDNNWGIIGQERAVAILLQSLARGSFPHAWLFTGDEHTGKMTLALKLAQTLNCEKEAAPCGTCTACEKIARGGHADVMVIGLNRNENDTEAKLIGIDQVKDIQHSANLPPFEGKQRVFIIENADLLSTDAANCLLKTLEEPPDHVTFLLLTVNEQLLLETIVSRCQRLELLPVPADVIAGAVEERYGVDEERADLLGRLAHGCPGWAIQALAEEGILAERDAELGKLIEIIRGGCMERLEWSAGVAANFSRDRKLVYRLLETWIDYWRDVLLVKLGCRVMITHIDREEELAVLASVFSLGAIRDCIRNIEAAIMHLKRNANPRLALDVLMLDIPSEKGGTGAPENREPVTYG